MKRFGIVRQSKVREIARQGCRIGSIPIHKLANTSLYTTLVVRFFGIP